MTPGGIPHTVEVRTLAARGVRVNGTLDIARMPRLEHAIVSASAPAGVEADFRRDEEGRYVLELDVVMTVDVACQRCLGPMPVELRSSSLLAAVWTDEQAGQLPARYDPMIAGDETDLWAVVEDELLLALPAFSYHDDASCGDATGVRQDIDEEDLEPSGEETGKENPFSVLATLKDDLTQN